MRLERQGRFFAAAFLILLACAVDSRAEVRVLGAGAGQKRFGVGPPVLLQQASAGGTVSSGTIVSQLKALAASTILNNGGPVMLGTVNIYYIWYGNWTGNSATTILTDYANHIGGSAYYNINSSYYDVVSGVKNYVSDSVAFGGSTSDSGSLGTALSEADIETIAQAAISSHALPLDPNGVYFVLTAANVTVGSFCSSYCGWHSNSSTNGIKYSFVGNPATQCPVGCEQYQSNTPNGNPGADGMASVISHELAETVTDPDINAWLDSSGNENGDLCAWTFGAQSSLPGGAQYNVPLGSRKYLLQEIWANVGAGSCVLALTPAITSALAASGTVGSPFSYTIAASNVPAGYSAAGLPSGLSVSTVTGAISGTPTSAGTSRVTLGATNAGGTGTATLTLRVVNPPPIVTSASSASGIVGMPFSYTITATNSPTSFSASPLPAYLSVDTVHGVVSGTPTAAGTVPSITVGAANSGGTGTASLAVSNYTAPSSAAPTSITPTSLVANWGANGNPVGTQYYAEISANAGSTWSPAPSGWTTATSAAFSGLTPGTPYSLRVRAQTGGGAPTAETPLPSTTTLLAAPVSPAFSSISTGSIVFSWGQGSNPGGLTYAAQASTAADFSGTTLTQSGAALSADFGNLSADTSYYFQVQAVGGAWLTVAAPQATLAAPPAAGANAFAALGATTASLTWTNSGDPADAQYKADLSPAADFSSGVLSSVARATFTAFSGLTPNTLYFARVAAISRSGALGAEVPLGSAATLVYAPTLPAQPFSGQTEGGFTFSFNATNTAGTRYSVTVSADPAFSVIASSANTASTSATFSGLLSNQAYNVAVAGLNQAGSPSAAASASTATLAASPLAGLVPVASTATSLSLFWAPGTLAAGTSYLAQLSSSPAFAFAVANSATTGTSAAFTGLQPNTTYYGRVQAVSLSANPNGPFLSLAGATWPNPPGAAAPPFPSVAFTSMTVAWTALPPSPSSAAAEGYLVQLSTAPDFSAVAASSSLPAGAVSAVVAGLSEGTTYYARVGAVGWEGAADFLALGAASTLAPPISSGTVTGAGLTLALSQPFAQVSALDVFVPPGAFPAGTPVSAAANLLPMPGSATNEASEIMPLGALVGFNLTAGGLQPAVPVRLSIRYDPAQLPLGQSESRLQLWRYDLASSQWTLVPSADDSSVHVLTAYTPHFSLFAPFFVAPGADVSSVQVFPQPWEIGDPASQYWASALTFTGLPSGATVKILTATGELVWSGAANGGGVLTWDGGTRFGRQAASGTYYALFQSGGHNKTRRVVIIR